MSGMSTAKYESQTITALRKQCKARGIDRYTTMHQVELAYALAWKDLVDEEREKAKVGPVLRLRHQGTGTRGWEHLQELAEKHGMVIQDGYKLHISATSAYIYKPTVEFLTEFYATSAVAPMSTLVVKGNRLFSEPSSVEEDSDIVAAYERAIQRHGIDLYNRSDVTPLPDPKPQAPTPPPPTLCQKAKWVVSHSGGKLHTFRGDGGYQWEVQIKNEGGNKLQSAAPYTSEEEAYAGVVRYFDLQRELQRLQTRAGEVEAEIKSMVKYNP